MSRIRSIFGFTAPLALLAMTACAPTFNAKVNRFQMMPVPQGQSFAIKAEDPKLAGSLEFAHYSSLVAQKLMAQGYQPASSPSAATLLVSIDYGVDQGKEKQRYVPGSDYRYGYGFGPSFGYFDPWYRPYGYWPRSYRHGGGFAYMSGFYDPFLFGGGYDEVENYTVYTSGLDMRINRQADGQRVFEGKAQAMSLNDNLTYLVPNLVEAMFTGFPGNSGETVKITIAPPKKK
jgi:Domain of unknown function (DUF4136)